LVKVWVDVVVDVIRKIKRDEIVPQLMKKLQNSQFIRKEE